MSIHRPIHTTLAGAAVAALILTACGSGSVPPSADRTTPAATPTPTESVSPSTSATPDPGASDDATEPPEGDSPDDGGRTGEVEGVPIYYVVESPHGPKLVREFRSVPEAGDPFTTAVLGMMSVPPKDPDYSSAWTPSDDIEVTRDGDRVTVDVPTSTFGQGIGAAYEEASYQQLVYTATAMGAWIGEPVTEVVLLQDGKPGDGWGHVGVGDVWTRAPALEVLHHVWVLSPSEGQTVPAGEVTFRGYGTSFEANFVWHITGNGVDLSHWVMSDNAFGFGEFEFTVDLKPGTYTVTVNDSSGKDAAEEHSDSKTFIVE